MLTGIYAFTNALDHWLGIGAYSWAIVVMSLVFALFFGTWWKQGTERNALWMGLGVFLLFVGILFLPPPSERILRSAMLKVAVGTDADAIDEIVAEEYQGSPYVFPAITVDEERVRVSLLSQDPGNCTAIIFKIVDGKVVQREFMAD